ncbi:hypothetical protein H9Q71_007511 [Fusarium xylarioides]|nr:hypothetical protein H9Q71_007511 [Fusarium xylarioides]
MHAFFPKLNSPVSKGDFVSPLFVIRDTINAFFRGKTSVMYESYIEPLSLGFWSSGQLDNDSTRGSVPETTNSEQPEDETMEDITADEPVDAPVVREHGQPSVANALKRKSLRIFKVGKKSKPSQQTIVRQISRSPLPAVTSETHHDMQFEQEKSATSPEAAAVRVSDEADSALAVDAQVAAAESPNQTMERQDFRDALVVHNFGEMEVESSTEPEMAGVALSQADTQNQPTRAAQTIERRDYRSLGLGNEDDIRAETTRAEPAVDTETMEKSQDIAHQEPKADSEQTIERGDRRSPPRFHSPREERTYERENTSSQPEQAKASEPEIFPTWTLRRMSYPIENTDVELDIDALGSGQATLPRMAAFTFSASVPTDDHYHEESADQTKPDNSTPLPAGIKRKRESPPPEREVRRRVEHAATGRVEPLRGMRPQRRGIRGDASGGAQERHRKRFPLPPSHS